MAQATLHQVLSKPKAKRHNPDQWAADNRAGREAAEDAISACARSESPMEIVSTFRRMVTAGKLSGFDVGYITAIAEAAISADL